MDRTLCSWLKVVPGEIDLLLTDVIMSGINGKELFETAPEVTRPKLEVIFMSGYPDDVIAPSGVLDPNRGVHCQAIQSRSARGEDPGVLNGAIQSDAGCRGRLDKRMAKADKEIQGSSRGERPS